MYIYIIYIWCIYDVYMMYIWSIYDPQGFFFELETSKVSGEEAVAIYTTTVSWRTVEVSPKVLEDEF